MIAKPDGNIQVQRMYLMETKEVLLFSPFKFLFTFVIVYHAQ